MQDPAIQASFSQTPHYSSHEGCQVNIATRLGALGVRAGDVRSLVEDMAWDRTKVLPHPLSPEEARDIFSALL